MKRLAICIPNYNRICELRRLLVEIVEQIEEAHIEKYVQICISDDCSEQDPTDFIMNIQKKANLVDIKYQRFNTNQGMDYNFYNCVSMAETEYCWIIGNDDVPEDGAIKSVIDMIAEHNQIDFFVTPFYVFNSDCSVRLDVKPLDVEGSRLFNTNIEEDKEILLKSTRYDSAIFGFLSNVVFKRYYWIDKRDKYVNKFNSIFIQVYINLDTLMNGALYYYWDKKIIKNYADDEMNKSPDRTSKILVGLDGVIEHFFSGEIKQHFKHILTDALISGRVWEISDENEIKQQIVRIESKKNKMYKLYYIDENDICIKLKDERVLIYGAGEYGRQTYEKLVEFGIQIEGVADSDRSKEGVPFDEFEIIHIDNALNLVKEKDLFVLVANHFGFCEMVEYLVENSINKIGTIV